MTRPIRHRDSLHNVRVLAHTIAPHQKFTGVVVLGVVTVLRLLNLFRAECSTRPERKDYMRILLWPDWVT